MQFVPQAGGYTLAKVRKNRRLTGNFFEDFFRGGCGGKVCPGGGSAGYNVVPVRQDRAGRSLGAAEARSSLPNLRALRRPRPEETKRLPFILNLEF